MVGGWEVPFILWVRNSGENDLRGQAVYKEKAFQTYYSHSLVWKKRAQMLCIRRKQGWGISCCSLFDG